jgi:hypothetical protein
MFWADLSAEREDTVGRAREDGRRLGCADEEELPAVLGKASGRARVDMAGELGDPAKYYAEVLMTMDRKGVMCA